MAATFQRLAQQTAGGDQAGLQLLQFVHQLQLSRRESRSLQAGLKGDSVEGIEGQGCQLRPGGGEVGTVGGVVVHVGVWGIGSGKGQAIARASSRSARRAL